MALSALSPCVTPHDPWPRQCSAKKAPLQPPLRPLLRPLLRDAPRRACNGVRWQLLERMASLEEGHQRDLERLEQRAEEDREARMRSEEDGMRQQASAQEEVERLEAEIEQEIERRTQLQASHEREVNALKSALFKATGFKDGKAPAPAVPKEKSHIVTPATEMKAEITKKVAKPSKAG